MGPHLRVAPARPHGEPEALPHMRDARRQRGRHDGEVIEDEHACLMAYREPAEDGPRDSPSRR